MSAAWRSFSAMAARSISSLISAQSAGTNVVLYREYKLRPELVETGNACALPYTVTRICLLPQQGLLHERYQKGAEMLGSELLSVRLGGIYALQRLAENHPGQYHIQIMHLFCAFVRHPTTDASVQAKSSPGRKYPRLRVPPECAISSNSDPCLLAIYPEPSCGIHWPDCSLAASPSGS